jgi:mannose-1-phosphate guanylyltransferase
MRHAVVLAGGSGKRLWPMSTREMPKQLVPFPDGSTLLEAAVDRVAPLVERRHLYICAAERHRVDVLSRLPGVEPASYLGEPVGRDTCAAIGLAAVVATRGDPEAVLGVFTSDQVIRPVDRFRDIVSRAYELAGSGADIIVTFGIVPTAAATSYGYLELGEVGPEGALRVRRFREKPDAASARAMLAAGPERYLWNSGMFVFRAAAVLDRIRARDPGMAAGLDRIARAWGTADAGSVMAEVYETLRSVSFDYAVMEPSTADAAVRVLAVPMPLEWVDVGSWPAYAGVLAGDPDGNVTVGGTALVDTHGTVVVSRDPGHLVALLGCEDLVVVHTPRATLVMPRARAEELKNLVARVAELHGDEWL